MRLSYPELLSRLASSYWFVPLLVTVCGAALALGLLTLDGRVELDDDGALRWLYPSTPEGGRALLGSIIGSMITAISVTFSVTVVAFTVAAQHFGPRVINNFVRETSAQVALGLFLATFVYAVLVLGAVDGTDGTGLPQLALIGAVGLVLASVGGLIFYLHHISRSLQLGRIAADISADLSGAVRRQHDRERDAANGGETGAPPPPPPDAAAVCATETGYIQRIDFAAAVALAEERGATIWLDRGPGAFVTRGVPLAHVAPGSAVDDEFVARFERACVLGDDRTTWQDADFAVNQLVEIALRGLSPGTNEPFTALTCIDRLTDGLGALAAASPPRAAWHGNDGRPRVFANPQRFGALARAAFHPIRVFAGPNPAVYVRLLERVADLACVATRPDDLAVLRRLADATWRTAAGTVTDDDDRRWIERCYRRTVGTPQLRGANDPSSSSSPNG